jgi:hypothetical protein
MVAHGSLLLARLSQVFEDRSALRFASRRQRRDVDVVVASLSGAFGRGDSDALSAGSPEKRSRDGDVSTASEIQVVCSGL